MYLGLVCCVSEPVSFLAVPVSFESVSKLRTKNLGRKAKGTCRPEIGLRGVLQALGQAWAVPRPQPHLSVELRPPHPPGLG